MNKLDDPRIVEFKAKDLNAGADTPLPAKVHPWPAPEILPGRPATISQIVVLVVIVVTGAPVLLWILVQRRLIRFPRQTKAGCDER